MYDEPSGRVPGRPAKCSPSLLPGGTGSVFYARWMAETASGYAGGEGGLYGSSALMVEALAIRDSLLVCLRLSFWEVVVESDAQRCIEMINGNCEPDADIEGLIFDIQRYCTQFNKVVFTFAPRLCNKAAHAVARFVTNKGGSHVWDNIGTEWLFDRLAEDVNIDIRF
ncbi:hypothetical protein ACE6H2_011771 [Prunus campanulata]